MGVFCSKGEIMLILLHLLLACGEKQAEENPQEPEDTGHQEEDYSAYCNEDPNQNLIAEDQDCDGVLTEDDCDDDEDFLSEDLDGDGECDEVVCYGDYFLDSTSMANITQCNVITGSLHLRYSELSNLNGLEQLFFIGDGLYIVENPLLTSLDGLLNLSNIGGVYILENDSLENIDGFSGLSAIDGTISFENNAVLENVAGLSNLTSIGSSLNIDSNASLENLDGLSNLDSVGTSLSISNNSSLLQVDGIRPRRDSLDLRSI